MNTQKLSVGFSISVTFILAAFVIALWCTTSYRICPNFSAPTQVDTVTNSVQTISTTISIDELKEFRNDLLQEIKQLDVKISKLQTASRIEQQTELVFVPDTIFVNDTIRELMYNDTWTHFSCDSEKCSFRINDTIIVTTERGKRKFWIFGKRANDKITVRNRCPYVSTDNVEFFTIE